MHSGFGMFLVTNQLGKKHFFAVSEPHSKSSSKMTIHYDGVGHLAEQSPQPGVILITNVILNNWGLLILDVFTFLELNLHICSLVEHIFSVS